MLSEPPEANEQLADIFEEYAGNQTRWILDFADTLEKMLANGYVRSELVDAPDHYTGVVCPREKENAGNKFYNCCHAGKNQLDEGRNSFFLLISYPFTNLDQKDHHQNDYIFF